MSSNTNIGNTPVNQGYVQLIHTGETGGIDGTLRTLYDGDGTASDLQIASNKVKVSTELYIGSKTATEFIQDIVGDMFTTGSYTNITTTYDDTNGNIDLNATGAVSGITGGTGIDATGSGNITIAIDSTVATLTGTQTLTNKTLTAPTLTGTTQGASITLSGDLTVNGTTTTVNQTNLDVSDNIIGLNRGASSNANDSGLIIERGSTGDNAAIIWDESADKFTLGTTTSTPSATGDLTISTGTLVANVEGNVSGNLTTDSVTISTIQTGSESFADNDTSLMTSAAIQDKITSYGYVTSSGISFNGSTANGLLTYGNSTTADVESNLTFDGSHLSIASTGRIYLDGGGDTFWYEAVPNVPILVTGGTERFRVNNVGNVQFNVPQADANFRISTTSDVNTFFVDAGTDRVGIGTNSPASPLHISNSTDELLKLTSTGANSEIRFSPNTSTFDVRIGATASSANSEFYIETAGTKRLYVDNSGNVGIGVTSPGALFTVRKDGTQASSVSTTYQIQTVSDSNGGMAIQAGGTSSAYLVFGDNANYDAGRIQYNNSNNQMSFWTADTKHMSITSAGNVGIGVTSPQDKLHIEGTTSSTRMRVKTTTGSAEARLITNNGDWILSSSGSSNQFQIYNATTSSTYFAIDSNGDVGIGGGTTSFKLDVQGGSARISSGGLGVGVNPSGTTGRGDFSNDVVAFSTSDKRLKENIKPLDNALDKVLKISGVEFDWKELTKEEKKTIHGNKGHDVGVIAQEIEEVLPEVVTTRDSGYKAVKYEKIVPLLIQAIKEQQQQIEELKNG